LNQAVNSNASKASPAEADVAPTAPHDAEAKFRIGDALQTSATAYADLDGLICAGIFS